MAIVSEMATISEARKSVCRDAWNRNKINQDDSNVGSLSKNEYWLQFGFSLTGSSSKVLLRWPPVQCFAGYCDVKYGHLLEGEKQKGVIINTCKEFNLLPPHKGDPLIRATPPT